MALKFQLLLLLILGLVFVQSARLLPGMEDIPAEDQEKRGVYYPSPSLPRCDWPAGFCVYIYDPCPQGTQACNSQYGCSLATNKCCCWSGYGRR